MKRTLRYYGFSLIIFAKIQKFDNSVVMETVTQIHYWWEFKIIF